MNRHFSLISRLSSTMLESRHQHPPERNSLLLLVAALEVATDAVVEQHPRLVCSRDPPHPSLPASELLAELVVTRCAELQDLVERYNAVIDQILTPEEDLF